SEVAYKLALELEDCNECRQKLCEQIEEETLEIIQSHYLEDPEGGRIICLLGSNWHHGVIGIVASRLVERYGVPVFIGTMEGDQHIRGSARGIPEFSIF
ncbi:MAG: single-stranded-DNA-specific exonuclease RecJ, partial [Nostoc sp.]